MGNNARTEERKVNQRRQYEPEDISEGTYIYYQSLILYKAHIFACTNQFKFYLLLRLKHNKIKRCNNVINRMLSDISLISSLSHTE